MTQRDDEIQSFIDKTVKDDIKQAESRLKMLKKFDNNDVTKPPITYLIYIRSGWENYGEKGVVKVYKDLNQGLLRTMRHFKKINDRSDVQGDVTVFVKLGNVIRYRLPDNLYADTVQKYKDKVKTEGKP